MSLQCELQSLPEETEINVGTPLQYRCQGDVPSFAEEKLQIKVPDADKYKIKLLNYQKLNSNETQLVVTSYQAGLVDLQKVELTDGQIVSELKLSSFQVKSVINPQEPPEGPFPPRGPIAFGLPLWYWLILAVIVLAIAGWIAVVIKRKQDRKKLVANVLSYANHLTAHNQFHQSLRFLRKKYPFLTGLPLEGDESQVQEVLTELNQSFRIFLGRLFLCPSLSWKDSLILKDIKKHNSQVFDKCQVELRQGLFELSRALKRGEEKIPPEDVKKLMLHLTKIADHVEGVNNQLRKSS